MRSLWVREAWIVVALAMGSLFFAAFIGHVAWIFAFGLTAYLIVVLYQLGRLHGWILEHPKEPPPDLPALWGEIANVVYRRERAMERRQDQMADILERFQRVSAAVPDAMVVLSQNDEIQWLNPAAERLLGLHSPRDHGARIVNLVRSPDFRDYLAQGDFSQGLPLAPLTGEHQLSAQVVPFADSLKLLICRDTTHLARLDEMRQQFVANVSHELRTPVTVLLGFLETLTDMRDLPGTDWHGHFAIMHDQALRMQRLIDDLLVLSKLETSPPNPNEEQVDVPLMLKSLKKLGDAVAGDRGPRIVVDVDAGLGLLGSIEELRSAFSNLLSNAIRHTPPEGEVRLWWRRDDEGSKLSVIDTGEGIAAQHLAHLTERFYRVDTARSRSDGGTGLGLSIVKHILRRHQARLAIESRLGKGSTFMCVFPRSRTVALSQ